MSSSPQIKTADPIVVKAEPGVDVVLDAPTPFSEYAETLDSGSAPPTVEAAGAHGWGSPETPGNHLPIDPEDEDPDEGPIVRQYNVIFAADPRRTGLDGGITLWQFPTQLNMRRDHEPVPQAARIKPRSTQFQMDYPLDTQSSYYNTETGEQFAAGMSDNPLQDADQRGLNEMDVQAPLLDKRTVGSVYMPTAATYMAGVVRGDSIVLAPVSKVFRMKPVLAHVDRLNQKARQAAGRHADAERSAGSMRKEEARTVQVSIRAADDKDGQRRAAALEAQRSVQEEAWQPLDHHTAEDVISQELRRRLFPADDRGLAPLLMVKETLPEHLEHLAPRVQSLRPDVMESLTAAVAKKKAGTDDAILARKGLSLQEMTILPLEDRLVAMFLNASWASPYMLLQRFGPELTQSEAFRLQLTSVAVFIHGRWIIQSHLLYKDRVMQARRYLLGLFSQSPDGMVRGADFGPVVRLPLQMARNMLAEIAYLDPDRGGWCLKGHAAEIALNAEVPALAYTQQPEFVRSQRLGAAQRMELARRHLGIPRA
ncbi:hypothetical protein CXG81DRAFT_18796 [Caulochytrium protostelioides]|uniref:Uncharacterized protein n=1 Tax=Caulochytrium protostelioides TaxID=1555241 RepID=A0A4P9WVY9_9FUNG|nr:hypothetical protein CAUPRSCDRAFT_10851 [Caulochytrium protostelioides]RKP01375.1 hypothetical protein CXG81DRAFT_18796 [Caulochytrium protostelioides]|eukprot:RKP01375.1 hypothetical protein CXG81DRAFT_18796 [Caulochytrium protostelioides]